MQLMTNIEFSEYGGEMTKRHCWLAVPTLQLCVQHMPKNLPCCRRHAACARRFCSERNSLPSISFHKKPKSPLPPSGVSAHVHEASGRDGLGLHTMKSVDFDKTALAHIL